MKDIDRLLSRTLRAEADEFAPEDLAAAEQRFVRGRRKRRFTWFGGATLATAAAIVAVAVFPRPELVNEERLDVAAPQTTTISVGQEPVGIASTGDAVWVANSGDGTVSRIDPETNEVVATIEVGGAPEEVAAHEFSVWVYDAESRKVVEIDPSSNEVVQEYGNEWPEGTHLDLAVKRNKTLWMADPATQTVHSLGPPSKDESSPDDPETSVAGVKPERGGDVATEYGDGEVWAYNGDLGSLSRLVAADGTDEPVSGPNVSMALTAKNGDLAVGGGALWVSDDFGVIMRIDRHTFEKELVDVGGRYSDLAFGRDHLWALTATEADNGTATLRKIAARDGRLVGKPVPLAEDAVDIAADEEAVWVAHRDGASVSRIDISSDPEPRPTDAPDEPVAETPAEGAQIYFAFTANDDVYLEYSDGTTRQFTMTADIERNPVLGAVSIFFERHDHETEWAGIIEHNFVTGEDQIAAEGLEPAVSYGGDLAYVGGETGDESLYVAPMEGNGRLAPDHASIALSDWGLSAPSSLEWSDDGKALYLQARTDHWVTVQVPVVNGVPGDPAILDVLTDQPPGTSFIQPDNASSEAVEVVAVCCRELEGDVFSRLSIGRIVFGNR